MISIVVPVLLLLLCTTTGRISVNSFTVVPSIRRTTTTTTFSPSFQQQHQQQQQRSKTNSISLLLFAKQQQQQQQEEEIAVKLTTELTEERIKQLFAWIGCAFRRGSHPQYNNLMWALAAVFGTNLDESTVPKMLLKQAMKEYEERQKNSSSSSSSDNNNNNNNNNNCIGYSYSQWEREQNSLGAMGAGQFMGHYKTRPHALLHIGNYSSVEDWIATLPRGCRRTLKKANALAAAKNFTVTTKPILPNQPAPHSSLEHFACVVEHEVRLIAGNNNNNNKEDQQQQQQQQNIQDFFYALEVAISRYMGTTQMTGEIQEYRNRDGKVIAFAHEVCKARTIRGQWFYSTNEASKLYIWFHSVQELIRRAILTPYIDVVDLGPSGSDAFSALKERYGFQSVDDWPAEADYVSGPFRYICWIRRGIINK